MFHKCYILSNRTFVIITTATFVNTLEHINSDNELIKHNEM
jgi:hypothetical protein